MAGYTWTELVPKYKIDPEDLPLSHGVNVVVIDRVEFEKKEDKREKGKYYNQVDLYLFGWNVPLRLNQTKIKQLRDMFGDDINAAHGKKIALTVIVDNDDKGDPVTKINIHPYAVPDHTPPVPVPVRLAVQSDHARRGAAHHGVELLGSDGQTRPIASRAFPAPDWASQKPGMGGQAVSPRPEPKPARERTGEPIGVKVALEVYKTLHKVGRNRGDLIAHVGKSDTKLASHMSDVPASEWPDVVLDFARSYCGSLPAVQKVEAIQITKLQEELDADLAEYYRRREQEAGGTTDTDPQFTAAVAGKSMAKGQPELLGEDDIPF